MRLPGCCVLTGLGGVVVSVTAPCVQVRADDFQISFAVGSRTRRGHVAGRIEMRLLTAHAGNGYWEDQPGPEGRQGAQIRPLDGPGSPCRVDHAFHEGLQNGRWRDLAVGALTGANFATDGSGAPLPRPIALLCPTAFSPAVIDPTAQAASAGALQRNSTHRAFRRLFPPVPAACGSVGDCQAHFLQRGSPFLGVSADPRADDAIGGHGGSHR
jgi:hypothetical protein